MQYKLLKEAALRELLEDRATTAWRKSPTLPGMGAADGPNLPKIARNIKTPFMQRMRARIDSGHWEAQAHHALADYRDGVKDAMCELETPANLDDKTLEEVLGRIRTAVQRYRKMYNWVKNGADEVSDPRDEWRDPPDRYWDDPEPYDGDVGLELRDQGW